MKDSDGYTKLTTKYSRLFCVQRKPIEERSKDDKEEEKLILPVIGTSIQVNRIANICFTKVTILGGEVFNKKEEEKTSKYNTHKNSHHCHF